MALNKFLSIVVLLLVSAASLEMSNDAQSLPVQRPLVIGHRGSSGVLPEHTTEAYRRAISDGADVIECDVTLSRDLLPVCLHDELLQKTTDVADRPEFANRNRSITVNTGDSQVVSVCMPSILATHPIQPSMFA